MTISTAERTTGLSRSRLPIEAVNSKEKYEKAAKRLLFPFFGTVREQLRDASGVARPDRAVSGFFVKDLTVPSDTYIDQSSWRHYPAACMTWLDCGQFLLSPFTGRFFLPREKAPLAESETSSFTAEVSGSEAT